MRTLWRLVHALEVRSKWMARNLGITGPQRLVVRIVGRAPEIDARGIAQSLEMHPSTLTGILGRLERGGYLRRVADAADRRRARFRLTARGEAIDRERGGTVEDAVRNALARASSEELAATERLLERLTTILERDGQVSPRKRRK